MRIVYINFFPGLHVDYNLHVVPFHIGQYSIPILDKVIPTRYNYLALIANYSKFTVCRMNL